MKATISKIAALVMVGIFSSAFSSKPGGEGYEIYLNNKIIVQHYGTDDGQVKSFQLTAESAKDRLTVKYFHCGKAGKNRVISIRDVKNTVLKTLRYPDTERNTAMEVPLKNLVIGKGSITMKLVYSSSELTKERVLANVTTTMGTVAGRY